MNDSGIVTAEEAESMATRFLEKAGVVVTSVSSSVFPEETVILVRVDDDSYDRALELGASLDFLLQERGFDGFSTIRRDKAIRGKITPLLAGVHDERAARLVEVLSTRSRTSETQPSLFYVPDVAANSSLITAARHHLVFGRRGAGKTALLLEGKRVAEANGSLVAWSNIQTYRDQSADQVFMWVVEQLLDTLRGAVREDPRVKVLASAIDELQREVHRAVQSGSGDVRTTIPRLRSVLDRFGTTTARRLYVILDDFHYLPRAEQPLLLDLLHRALRDCDAWLKIAAIKHLTRWYDPAQHLGLQTGHDADLIELDLNLQDPARAKLFLESVLRRYATDVGIGALSKVLSSGALDRLVLASGAVPRDYLTLAARAVQRCRARPKSKIVGVQDVNGVAGDAARVKLDELEEDLASSALARNAVLEGLRVVREFCINERAFTYFRIDFREKEKRPEEYSLISELLDVRLLHLLEPSLSERHRAGERSEVFMLDLSQYSGQRLKHNVQVLDFRHGHFETRVTRVEGKRAIGDTPRRLITIFRAAPELPLKDLESAV
jgi:hypothetical protein